MKRNMLADITIDIENLRMLKEILVPVGTIFTSLPGFNPNDNGDGWIWELVDKEYNKWKRVQ